MDREQSHEGGPISETVERNTKISSSTVLPAPPRSSEAGGTRADADAEEDEALAKAEAALTLEEREQRWGFTISELHAATKVVRTLFTNPALFVGDPYLGDSRLYTMITRDRKSKKEHREVYKKIMNEEKSRRRRYQRLQDVEAVRKTTMKREREEALNALLLPPSGAAPLLLCEQPQQPHDDDDEEGKVASPLTVMGPRRRLDSSPSAEGVGVGADRTRDSGEVEGNAPPPDTVGVTSSSLTSSSPDQTLCSDTSRWSESELRLFRLVGAYENLIRLETALQRTRWWLPSSSPTTASTTSHSPHTMPFTETSTTTTTTSTSARCCEMQAEEEQVSQNENQPTTASSTSLPPSKGASSGPQKNEERPNEEEEEQEQEPEEDDRWVRSPTSPHFSDAGARRPHPQEGRQSSKKGGTTSEPVFPSSPGASLAALDPETQRAIIASQLTAQVYRYLPHEYGTQMPPPLFLGCPPAAAAEATQRCYIVWWKVYIARQLLAVCPLHPILSTATTTTTSLSHTEVVPLLKAAHDLVVLRRALPFTQAVARLELSDTDNVDVVKAVRRWMRHVHGEEDDDDAAAPEGMMLHRLMKLADKWYESAGLTPVGQSTRDEENGPPTTTTTMTTMTPEELLNELEAVLLHDRKSGLAAAVATVGAGAGGGAMLSLPEAALATLDLFIIRRLYGVAAVRRFGASPVVLEIAPPNSDAEEPDVFSVFDTLQVYAHETAPEESLRVSKWIGCYTCKVRYQQLHPYYYSMCHLCGEFNYNKRLMTADLRGKNVLLTGCRIKIGYAMALSLLRCGARLLGTSRFAHEALARFQAEPDYPLWKDRLHLFSLDLRDMWVTTQFCFFVRQYFGKLYAIINNAAQTIARTPEYTATLRAIEQEPPAALREALAADARSSEWHDFFCRHTTVRVGISMALDAGAGGSGGDRYYHLTDRPALQRATAAAKTTTTTGETATATAEDQNEPQEETPQQTAAVHAAPFTGLLPTTPTSIKPNPSGSSMTTTTASAGGVVRFDRYDTLAEESDTRETNSWVMKLAEVSGGEAAEVMAINALSPFILNSKLKPCLTNREGDEDPHEPRFIINVSAMEGQFYRFKQTTHPHTNMAKAALNMMSRTSGEDYAADGIYMNSVDTGWITDESPKAKKERRADQLMLCPLDEVDAAARCLDLIYIKSRVYGKFFKDFKEIPW